MAIATGLDVRKRRTKRAVAVRRRPKGNRGGWELEAGSWGGRDD
jgi:hypothetical protein